MENEAMTPAERYETRKDYFRQYYQDHKDDLSKRALDRYYRIRQAEIDAGLRIPRGRGRPRKNPPAETPATPGEN